MTLLLPFLLAVASFAPPSLDGAAFLAGAWHGEMQGAQIEEHWTTPRADAMIGMYRIVAGGKTVMTEMCSIESTPSGLVLYLRHFNPGLIAREEKDAPVKLPLESLERDRAAFYSSATKTRLIYELISSDELRVTLEKEQAGQIKKTTFAYRRMQR
jgi:hypothetical protein